MINNIKNKIKNLLQNKMLLLTGILAVILILAIVIIPGDSTRNIMRPRYETTPYEENLHEKNAVSIVVKVMEVSPKDGENIDIYTAAKVPILYTLSEPISARTANIEIEPQTALKVRRHPQNKYMLYVYPESEWKYDVEYKVTLKKELKSENGNFLAEDFTHSFTLHAKEPPSNWLAD